MVAAGAIADAPGIQLPHVISSFLTLQLVSWNFVIPPSLPEPCNLSLLFPSPEARLYSVIGRDGPGCEGRRSASYSIRYY